MATNSALPWWLGPASRLNLLMLRLGLRLGTPVSLVTLDQTRYIVSGEGLAWAKNARVAGWGTLERARRRERVTLTELPPEDRGPILRAFWQQVPGGRSFIARLFGLAPDASADDFEAAAPRCPVFRIR